MFYGVSMPTAQTNYSHVEIDSSQGGYCQEATGSVSFLLPNMSAKGSTCIQIHCENHMQ